MRIVFITLLCLIYSNLSAKEQIPGNDMIASSESLSLCSDTKIFAYSLIHVGHAALYMKDCENRNSQFFEKNKMISFHYDRAIPKKAFIKSTLKMLEKNLATDEMEKWRDEAIAFNKNYQDVEKGDQYDICYIKGNGLSLYLNNELIASNESDEFASIYFNIWFGDKPFNKSMKKKLM